MATSKDTFDLASTVEASFVRLRMPSRVDLIEPMGRFLSETAVNNGFCDEKGVYKVSLALHEALTNAVIHGNLEITSDLKELGGTVFAETLAQRSNDPEYCDREVEIVVDYDGQRARWSITDHGNGFDAHAVIARETQEGLAEDPEEAICCSGRGILMMRSFMDDVDYELGGRRCILTLNSDSQRDQRSIERLPAERQVRVIPVSDDGSPDWESAFTAMAHHLSKDLVSIVQPQLVPPGRILIEVADQGELIYLPAEINDHEPSEEGMIHFGCCEATFSFTNAEQPHGANEPLQDVVGAIDRVITGGQTHPMPSDPRRDDQRFVYTDRVGIVEEKLGTMNYYFARDLSHSGIAFISTKPFCADDITVQLTRDRGRQISLRARIVRCRRILGGFYDIGARFTGLG
ncbi:ATP-binding protein [Planctomycetes bacterium Pan216]|uniref:ATP-binding protein n=1 Tax=Kolteria novifilia TaxID=2527975 RepID=UPI0011AA547C